MTDRTKYVCHCVNCGDEFWINKTDADKVRCTMCKKMTPLIVKGTAGRVTDNFSIPIIFCPWCGKRVSSD